MHTASFFFYWQFSTCLCDSRHFLSMIFCSCCYFVLCFRAKLPISVTNFAVILSSLCATLVTSVWFHKPTFGVRACDFFLCVFVCLSRCERKEPIFNMLFFYIIGTCVSENCPNLYLHKNRSIVCFFIYLFMLCFFFLCSFFLLRVYSHEYNHVVRDSW